MKLTLQFGSAAPIDVTPRLDESFDLLLSQELERDAFERVIDDLRLRLSNLDGALGKLFTGLPPTGRCTVTVTVDDLYNGGDRVLFRGDVDLTTVSLDLRREWLSCTAFSLNRVFWDRAKVTRIRTSFSQEERALVYAPMASVVEREIGATRTAADGSALFQGNLFRSIDIRNGLGDRPIRFCADAPAATGGESSVGNNGKYADLDPQTTVYDLLTAICLYNNAECFIDCSSEQFVLQKRVTVNEDRVAMGDPEAVLDAALIETAGIEWLAADNIKYDFLYAPYDVTRAESPVYLGQRLAEVTQLGVLAGGRYLTYYLTNVVGGYEAAPSLPMRILQQPNEQMAGPGVNEMGSYRIRLRIPAGSPATTSRRLYRSHPVDEDTVTLLQEFSGNAVAEFEDTLHEQPADPLPADGPAATAAWFSFDHTAGRWNAPLLDYPAGVNEPGGKVLRILPRLTFRSSANSALVLPYDLYDVFSFFGRDNSFDRIVQLFDTLLAVTRKVRCSVRGINFRIGDTVSLHVSGLPEGGGAFVVRKATVNLSSEQTQLELIAL